jgi:primosomal protein N' (replication factor Y)
VPAACPECGNPDLAPIGQGTQRIEATLEQRFPEARILRIDRDSTRRKHTWSEMRERISARDVDILVGTQILAKGHDFPHLSLVGVLNADAMLYSADFRASERLYALLTQVAGRAGRRDIEGEVLIQTEFPNHAIYAALRNQNFSAFAETLLEERRSAGFPPFVHQALLRAEAAQLGDALEFLHRAREVGRALNGVEIYGSRDDGQTRWTRAGAAAGTVGLTSRAAFFPEHLARPARGGEDERRALDSRSRSARALRPMVRARN